MEPEKTDRFNYRPWLAAAVTAAFFVPLMVFGGPALAKSASSASEYEYGGSSQYQYKGKVTICHHTHSKKHPFVTITVGAPAVKAHMRNHHDTLGPCPTTAAPAAKSHGKAKATTSSQATTGTSGTSSTHGKSGEDHGNSAGKGKGH